VSLLHLRSSELRLVPLGEVADSEPRLEIYSLNQTGGLEGDGQSIPVLQVSASLRTLQEFNEALCRLIKSRDEEGKFVLDFISKRLFQYLRLRQSGARSDMEIFQGRAVLAFNLEPKQGVAYIREQLGKRTDAEVGAWLAHMASNKGGIDPTLLGNYFSRLDTIEVTKAFISRLDFEDLDLVDALRRLFDTFKPGGESQVITRILEFFGETYLSQWQRHRSGGVNYSSSDSVLQVAVSLIMLNTGLHVLPKKTTKQKGWLGRRPCFGNKTKKSTPSMTVEEYIKSTRYCVGAEEVPDEVLQRWYGIVKGNEISVEPLPRVPFSTLPVQPDIEGWLVQVLGSRVRRRLWAVLALQRLYLFFDQDMEPSETHDLKDYEVSAVARDTQALARLRKEQGGFCLGSCLAAVPEDLPEMVPRAFELRSTSCGGKGASRPSSSIGHGAHRARNTWVLVAETPDLMERWVNLISAGAYT
jgi:hypothetical protein